MADETGSDVSHEAMESPADILRYDKDELFRLQGAFGHLQDEWWAQHLKDLGPDVVDELHELQAIADTSHLRRRSKNSERRLRSKAKREALHALSINALGSDKDEHEECENSLEDSLDGSLHRVNENSGGQRHVGKGKGSRKYDACYNEDTPEPESFQPQAFAVEGEPNFESGPPEDGWEYLRRVKYEAARCPKVVVAEIDPTKLASEQTPYMPEIPEIPACPSDLRPSKEWEDQFLRDFSLLRMALSNIRVPPTFPAERIPSLRNKSAWEVRCFGFVTSVEDEECKELDSVTTVEQGIEPGDKEGATEAKTPSLPCADSATNESDCVASESRSELLDDDKELLEPIVEFIETQIEPLLNTGSVESSYVIDFDLITDYLPKHEPEELFNDSEYFINGELAEVGGDIEIQRVAYPSAGISQPEDGPVTNPQSLDLQSSTLVELDDVEGSSFEIVNHFDHPSIGEREERHGQDEGMNSLSSHPIPRDTKRDLMITADSVGSPGPYAHTALYAEVESLSGIETQANHLSTRDFEHTGNGIQPTQASAKFGVVECEDDHLEIADFVPALDSGSWTLDEAEFGELYSGMDSQFDSLTIGDPQVVQGQMEVNLPSFSDAELLDVEDVHLPTDDFVESLIGLEIYHSGNILEDDPEESVDGSGLGTEFKIDGPLEELFSKVFQQVGVVQLPFIQLLLRLDEVSRAALFRHHVSWLENVNGLPKDRALWLLALSAVVDMPLDSQTSAAFRAMLRHCSGVRALKQTRDDEDLYLLNVLITVAGIYFGQAEATLLQQLDPLDLMSV